MADYTLSVKLLLDDDFSGPIEQAKGKATGFGDVLKGTLAGNLITTGISKITQGVKTLGSSMMEAGKSFESQMDKVGAISGASAEDMQKLTAKAQEMGSKTKFTATQSGEAFEYMAMAGWKTGDMLDGIEGIMSLAAASGEDLGTTSDILTDALTAFGLTAKDSGAFADVLAAASSNANTNVSMMGETFKYAAPIAGALGFSVEDTAEAIGLMANAGIKGSQAGTSLRQIMNSLSKDVKISGKAIGDVVVKTQNADGSMRDLGEIVADCRGAFSKLSESEKAAAAESIVGKNAMSGFLAIMNAAPGDVEKLNTAIANSAGASAQMAATMQDNLEGQLTLFSSAAEGFQLAIYEGIQEPLKNIVAFGADAVSQLTEGFKANGVPGLFAAAQEVAGSALNGIQTALPGILNTGAEIIAQLVAGIAAGLPGVITAAIEITDNFLTGIIGKLDKVLDAGDETTGEFSEGLLSGLSSILEAGSTLIEHLALGIMKLLPKLVQRGGEVAIGFAGGILERLPDFATAGGNLIAKLIGGIVEMIPDLIEKAQQMMGQYIKEIASHAGDIGEAGGNLIFALAKGIINNAPAVLKGFSSLSLSLLNVITSINWLDVGVDIIYGIGKGIAKAGGYLWDVLYDAISDAWDNTLNWLGIASPSKRARDEIGYYWGAGIGPGFSEGLGDQEGKMVNALGATMGALSPDAITAGSRGTRTETVSNTSRAFYGGINIHVQGAAGQSEDAIADRVMSKLYDYIAEDAEFA